MAACVCPRQAFGTQSLPSSVATPMPLELSCVYRTHLLEIINPTRHGFSAASRTGYPSVASSINDRSRPTSLRVRTGIEEAYLGFKRSSLQHLTHTPFTTSPRHMHDIVPTSPIWCWTQPNRHCWDKIASISASGSRTLGPSASIRARWMMPGNGKGAA